MKTPLQYRQRKRLLLITIASLLIIGGTLLWILGINNVIKGPWSNIPSLIFTVFGVVLALIQVLAALETSISSFPSQTSRQSYYEEIDGIKLHVNKHKGALIIYTTRQLCGSTIHLGYGFNNSSPKTDLASTVVGHKRKNRMVFVSYFPSLNPGNYTVHMDSPELVAKVTIAPEHVTEIDWRWR